MCIRDRVMRRVGSRLEEHVLDLATGKTEIVLQYCSPCDYWEQIKYAADKAVHVTTKHSRLMVNVGVPTTSKRRLLMAVTEYTLLYFYEFWADALKTEKYIIRYYVK